MSSTAGTPPSPNLQLPPLSPEQPKSGILINPEPERLSISIPPTSPHIPSPISAGKSPSSGQQRIRFAPLPDPRPRSLSTGRNIGWTPGVDEDGNETRHMEVRNIPQSSVSYDTDDAITDDDDEDGERRMRGRSWSKGMESSWKISKKILTVGMWDDKDEKKETYDGGMPLKKSVSTGGMIGSSPFRWSSVEDRRRSMQSLPAPTPAHRRTSSVTDPSTSSSSLGTSPIPPKIKLMNGRVYGARRASEIAEMQKKVREAAEPEFVEWGNAREGTAAFTASTGGGRGLLGDDDDGSGMDWVKKRREARQRRESEKKEREAAEAPQLVHTQSSPEAVEITVTPASKAIELPPTPTIHISEPVSPGSAPMDIEKRRDSIPDVFEEDEEEDEGDDGDFSSDEEEEEEIDRTTSSAAGIEIMSRHHH